jgi:hypothetical protein
VVTVGSYNDQRGNEIMALQTREIAEAVNAAAVCSSYQVVTVQLDQEAADHGAEI